MQTLAFVASQGFVADVVVVEYVPAAQVWVAAPHAEHEAAVPVTAATKVCFPLAQVPVRHPTEEHVVQVPIVPVARVEHAVHASAPVPVAATNFVLDAHLLPVSVPAV